MTWFTTASWLLYRDRLLETVGWEQRSSFAWDSVALISCCLSALPNRLISPPYSWPHQSHVASKQSGWWLTESRLRLPVSFSLPHSSRLPEKPRASCRQGWCSPWPHSFFSCCHVFLPPRSFLLSRREMQLGRLWFWAESFPASCLLTREVVQLQVARLCSFWLQFSLIYLRR